MPDLNMQVFEEARRHQLVTEFDIQSQSELTDFQVQLENLDNPTQEQDNLVVGEDGVVLSHWNESVDFDTWVKMDIGSSGKRGLLIHGNAGLINESDGVGVFNLLYHNFENTLDGYSAGTPTMAQSFDGDYSYLPPVGSYGIHSNYGISLPYIYEYNYFIPNGQTGDVYDGSYSTDGSNSIDLNYGYPTALTWGYRGDAGWVDSGVSISLGSWHAMKIICYADNTYDLYTDNTPLVTGIGSYVITTVRHLIYSGKLFYLDSQRIRKYTATEPTVQINTPKNISTTLKSFGRAG